MARIEECRLGARVSFTDGWGGPASIVGRRVNNHAEGCLMDADVRHELVPGRILPDVVLMRFDAPVRGGPLHQILAVSSLSEDLMLL